MYAAPLTFVCLGSNCGNWLAILVPSHSKFSGCKLWV